MEAEPRSQSWLNFGHSNCSFFMNPARVFGMFLWAQLRRAPLVCKAHTQECPTGVPRSMGKIFLPNEPG